MTSGAQMGGGSQRMRANRKAVEASCLTCGTGFSFGEEIYSCNVCGAYNHARCWEIAGVCQHKSDPSANAVVPPPPPHVSAVSGQVSAVGERTFCLRCRNEILPGQGCAIHPDGAEGKAADGRVFVASPGTRAFEKGDTGVSKFDFGLFCENCADAVFTWRVWNDVRDVRIDMRREEVSTPDGLRAYLEVLDYGVAMPAKRRGISPEQARKEARDLGELWWKDPNAVRLRLTGTDAPMLRPSDTGNPENCPNCGLINPGLASRCDCGYDFTQGKVQPYPVPIAAGPVVSGGAPGIYAAGLAPDEQYCRQCHGIIKLGALKCRFCGFVLSELLRSDEMPDNLVRQVESQANTALWTGIIGIFICGPILGSMAISYGNKAIATMDLYPQYPGPRGRAQTGRVLGWVSWVFVVIYVIGIVSNSVPK